MSILRPEIDFEKIADEILTEVHSPGTPVSVSPTEIIPPSPKNQKPDLGQILEDQGSSLQAAARATARILNFGENDGITLKAAELVFRANGLMKDLEKENKVSPEINITIVGTGNQNLINLLVPK